MGWQNTDFGIDFSSLATVAKEKFCFHGYKIPLYIKAKSATSIQYLHRSVIHHQNPYDLRIPELRLQFLYHPWFLRYHEKCEIICGCYGNKISIFPNISTYKWKIKIVTLVLQSWCHKDSNDVSYSYVGIVSTWLFWILCIVVFCNHGNKIFP